MKKELFELLHQIFKPLSIYFDNAEYYNEKEKGLLCQPLWQYRHRSLLLGGVFVKLEKLLKIPVDNGNEILNEWIMLAKATLEIHEKDYEGTIQIFETLLKIIKNYEAKPREIKYQYAVSLLLTLLLRQSKLNHKIIAISLLQKRKYEGEIFSHQVRVELPCDDLQDLVYMDFSYINFSGCKLKDLNFSGFNFMGLQAKGNETYFGKINFRFACLQGAQIEDITISNSNFVGASFSVIANNKENTKALINRVTLNNVGLDRIDGQGMVFKPLKVENVTCRFANLYGADLTEGHFEQVIFEGTDFTKASLNDSRFTYARFKFVKGLTAEQLNHAHFGAICTIKLQRGKFTSQDIKTLQQKGVYVYLPQNANDCYLDLLKSQHGEFIAAERKENLLYWKNLPSQNITVVNDKGVDHLPEELPAFKSAILPSSHATYRLVEGLIGLTSDRFSYESMRLEFARLKKHPNSFFDFLYQEWQGPPNHYGRPASITIHRIQAIRNESLWQPYVKRRQQIREELGQLGVQALTPVKWHSLNILGIANTDPSQITYLPVLDTEVGECWLFHGTSQQVMQLITRGGFSTDFATKKWLAGWGALGKGVYLSDNFAKIATYTTCGVCHKSRCNCVKASTQASEKTDQPAAYWKALIVSRVILGRPYIDAHKSRKYKEQVPKGYHSSWGPWQGFDPSSKFDSNEFIVSDTSQLYPEFCVYYTDNELRLEPEPGPDKLALPSVESWLKEYAPFLSKDLAKLISDQLAEFHSAQRIAARSPEEAKAQWDSWQALENLHQAINKCYSSSLSQRCQQQLDELQLRINQYFRLWIPDEIMTREESYHVAAWAYDHFWQQQWEQAVIWYNSILEQQGENKAKHYIERGISYYHLEQWQAFIRDLNQAWLLNGDLVSQYLKALDLTDAFLKHSIELLAEGYRDSNRHSAWVQDVATWQADITFKKLQIATQEEQVEKIMEAWESYRWDLSSQNTEEATSLSDRQYFEQALQIKTAELPEGSTKAYIESRLEDLADEAGNRAGVERRRQTWFQQLELFASTPPSQTEIQAKLNWLAPHWSASSQPNDYYELKEGYLNKELIEALFCNRQNKVAIKLTDGEAKGRCIVKKLIHQGKVIAYLKFFPYYPLRQLAIDELCYRLSGYGNITTLAKLSVKIGNNEPVEYPVLLSSPCGMPVSEALGASLEDYYRVGKDYEIESQLDSYAFTWKLIESLILLPADGKADNEIPTLIPGTQRYRLINIDSDELPLACQSQSNSLAIYTIIWLLKAMDKPLNSLALKVFCRLSLPKVFEEWLNQLQKMTHFLIGDSAEKYLFTDQDVGRFAKPGKLPELEDLQSYRNWLAFFSTRSENSFERMKYKQGTVSFIDKILSNRELLSYWQQAEQLKHVLHHKEKINKGWSLLEKIEFTHFHEYQQACKLAKEKVKKSKTPLSLTACRRFHQLKGVAQQFYQQYIEVPITSSASQNDKDKIIRVIHVSRPTLVTPVQKAHQEIFWLESKDQLSGQKEMLKNHQDLYVDFWEIMGEIVNHKTLQRFSDETISDALREKVLKYIDWKKLTDNCRKELLKILIDKQHWKGMRHLRVAECPELSNYQLPLLLMEKPNLQSIQFTNCSSLSPIESLKCFNSFVSMHSNKLEKFYYEDTNKNVLFAWQQLISPKKGGYLSIQGFNLQQRELVQAIGALNKQEMPVFTLELENVSLKNFYGVEPIIFNSVQILILKKYSFFELPNSGNPSLNTHLAKPLAMNSQVDEIEALFHIIYSQPHLREIRFLDCQVEDIVIKIVEAKLELKAINKSEKKQEIQIRLQIAWQELFDKIIIMSQKMNNSYSSISLPFECLVEIINGPNFKLSSPSDILKMLIEAGRIKRTGPVVSELLNLSNFSVLAPNELEEIVVHFKQLKFLNLSGCHKLFNKENYLKTWHILSEKLLSLNELILQDIDTLQEINLKGQQGSFLRNNNWQKLKILNLKGCKELRKIKLIEFTYLSELDVKDCAKLATLEFEKSHIKNIKFFGCPMLIEKFKQNAKESYEMSSKSFYANLNKLSLQENRQFLFSAMKIPDLNDKVINVIAWVDTPAETYFNFKPEEYSYNNKIVKNNIYFNSKGQLIKLSYHLDIVLLVFDSKDENSIARMENMASKIFQQSLHPIPLLLVSIAEESFKTKIEYTQIYHKLRGEKSPSSIINEVTKGAPEAALLLYEAAVNQIRKGSLSLDSAVINLGLMHLRRDGNPNLKIAALSYENNKVDYSIRYFKGFYCENNPAIIGYDYKFKMINFSGQNFLLSVVDCGIQWGRVASMCKPHISGSLGGLIFASLKKDHFYKTLAEYKAEILASCPKTRAIIAIGMNLDNSSCDLSCNEARNIAKELGIDAYYECNGRTGMGIKEAFEGSFEIMIAKSGFWEWLGRPYHLSQHATQAMLKDSFSELPQSQLRLLP